MISDYSPKKKKGTKTNTQKTSFQEKFDKTLGKLFMFFLIFFGCLILQSIYYVSSFCSFLMGTGPSGALFLVEKHAIVIFSICLYISSAIFFCYKNMWKWRILVSEVENIYKKHIKFVESNVLKCVRKWLKVGKNC